MGLTMRLGTTLRMRMATSWKRPTRTPEAVEEIHRPMGTKLKKMARATMMTTTRKMENKYSMGEPP